MCFLRGSTTLFTVICWQISLNIILKFSVFNDNEYIKVRMYLDPKDKCVLHLLK